MVEQDHLDVEVRLQEGPAGGLTGTRLEPDREEEERLVYSFSENNKILKANYSIAKG